MNKLARFVVFACILSLASTYSLRKLTLDEKLREEIKDDKSYTLGPNGEHGLYELASTRQYLSELNFADTYDYHMVHPAKVNAEESVRRSYNPTCAGDSAWKRSDIFVPFPTDVLATKTNLATNWFCVNTVPNLDNSPSVLQYTYNKMVEYITTSEDIETNLFAKLSDDTFNKDVNGFLKPLKQS